MSATEVLWWIFAGIIVITSLGVVVSRSVIHSAIFLIASLAGVGAMYVFLMVEFLALVQFLVYGGAVTVLVLLALILTEVARASTVTSTAGLQPTLVGDALRFIERSCLLPICCCCPTPAASPS